MMRKIGFGLRFTALTIDVFIIIILVFVLNSVLGKSLYTSIGTMKKTKISKSTSVLNIINYSAIGAEAQNSTENNRQKRENIPTIPREQRTRYSLPSTEQQTTEEQSAQTTPQIIQSEQEKLNKLAEQKQKGYIHSSKDFIKIFFFALISILFFLIEGLTGFTPGKLILRLKIFNFDRSKANKKTLIFRYLIKIGIPSFILLLYTLTKINFLWTIGIILYFLITSGCFFVFSNSLQTLHDRITKTAVFSLFLKEIDVEN